jgi:hypothetical protein
MWRWWNNWWNEDWQGERKYSERTCPTATLSVYFFLNKFINLFMKRRLAKSFFSSSLKSSVTDLGILFRCSQTTSIILALWSSYSLQSQKICPSVCSPTPHSHSAVDTMLNLLKLALWVEPPVLIRFNDMKAWWFILSRGTWGQVIPLIQFKVTFSSVPFGVLTETVKLLFAFLFPLVFEICHW